MSNYNPVAVFMVFSSGVLVAGIVGHFYGIMEAVWAGLITAGIVGWYCTVRSLRK